MNEDCLKLTIYFGERDRVEGAFLADALTELSARHGLQTSVVLRGIEGFGAGRQLRTDRLLTPSEDLPIVFVGVDKRERIEAALEDLGRMRLDGLVTVERARMLTGSIEAVELPAELHEATKLTVYVGRRERVAGRLASEGVVEVLHRRGVAGATVLLGVDGTAHGARRRARLLGRNTEVPVMVIAVGDGRRIAEALADLGAMLPRPLMTLERVRVCKRDGVRLSTPPELPESDEGGLGIWQKLTVYAGEHARHEGHPLSHRIILAPREAGAAGATSLRGVWGFYGNHAPHGDSFWRLGRRVPVLTVVVDTPARIRDWFALIDELTDETGLVTSETVPASRATAPQLERGGLRLARRLP